MATAATRQEKNLVQQKDKRTDLTPTGLLMEGDYTHLPRRLVLTTICYGFPTDPHAPEFRGCACATAAVVLKEKGRDRTPDP